MSFVARRYGLSPSLLFTWKRRMLEGGREAVQANEDVVGTSKVRELEKRVRDLERLLGRKTMGSRSSRRRSTSHGQKNRCCRSSPGALRRAVLDASRC